MEINNDDVSNSHNNAGSELAAFGEENSAVTQQQQVTTTSGLVHSILKLMENPKSMPVPPRAPDLLHLHDQQNPDQRLYWDRSHYDSPASQLRALAKSATLYVGNLAFTTRVAHVRSHFGQLGSVQRIIMGLDRIRKTPCGFCFVQFNHRKHALAAVSQLSGTKLDGRVIRVELDAGFQPGRQYGRGVSGGQVRDDRRQQHQQRTQQQQQQPDQRTSGQKRSFGGSDREAITDTNRPRLDDALPSSRKPPSSTGVDNNESASFGPGGGEEGAGIPNQGENNEENDNNNNVEGNISAGGGGRDDNDDVMDDGPSPSKRQKR